MAVFIGGVKNTSAAKAGLKINYAVLKIINEEIASRYSKDPYQMRHCVGIDTSDLFVAKTGIRGSNDLVWVGRAANYAAKMCSLRNGNYATWITKDVYDMLKDEAKNGGEPKRSMWESFTWTAYSASVYASTWHWKP